MSTLTFHVHGSQPDPYTVKLKRAETGRLTVTCTCQAADNGLLCKHRVNLLAGEHAAVRRSAETKKLPRVREMLEGSNLEAPVFDVIRAQEAFVEAEAARKATRRKLGRLMVE